MASSEPYLIIETGGRTFAIAGSRVAEVARFVDAAPGPLLHLSALLGGQAVETGARTCVVTLGRQQGDARPPIGLVVDEATDVVTFDDGDLLPPPDFGPNISLPYLAALARRDDGYAIVLDVDRLVEGSAPEKAMVV